MAVTPIVDAVPIVDSGEAQRARARQELMRARELAHTPMAVAGLYHDLAATFVLDGADAENEPMIQAKKMGVIVTDTILADADRGRRLAEVLLSCVGVTP
ncbi:MAG: hypothetical protein GY724_04715 [Actinomycetia bacterium]|nr:hypothetical protein [Actinomycetes bacterium]